uniref:Uncharacterized protein n=1 Tax=Angiostrongylus cantonensis TaxID=6313 RepID=A0A158PCK1_ANGCA
MLRRRIVLENLTSDGLQITAGGGKCRRRAACAVPRERLVDSMAYSRYRQAYTPWSRLLVLRDVLVTKASHGIVHISCIGSNPRTCTPISTTSQRMRPVMRRTEPRRVTSTLNGKMFSIDDPDLAGLPTLGIIMLRLLLLVTNFIIAAKKSE